MTAPATGGRKVPSNRLFVGVGVLVALVLAFFVSPMASTSPDGLNKVAADHGVDSGAKQSATAKSPTANYQTRGVSNARVSKGVSGVIGVLLTLGLGWALFAMMKRMRRQAENLEASTGDGGRGAHSPPGEAS